jgi:DNA-binding winged helix-turn-helix (wHTH) protein
MSANRNTNTEPNGNEFLLGDWTVQPNLNQLRRNGESVSLQNLSMQVLLYLAEHKGEVVTYGELLDALWPKRVVGEDAVHRRVADLRRHMGDSTSDPKYIQTIHKKGYRLIAPVKRIEPLPSIRWRPVAVMAALVLAVSALSLLMWEAPELPPPAVEAPPAMARVAIETSPPGAMVSYKPYAEAEADWQPIGVTPFEAELPQGTFRLRFIADGREPVVMAAPNPSMLFNNVDRGFFVVELPASGQVPEGMVFVPAGNYRLPLVGSYNDTDLGEFYIGRTEVSNGEYADFVAMGGYRNEDFWQDLEEQQGADADAMRSRFVDTTGKPGPAGWVGGTFPQGEGDLPVTGVSWYEAMAYARFRGMQLPTARHWARAALGIDEGRWPLARDLLNVARTSSPGPGPVDDDTAMSTWGAVNLIGNVREWTTSSNGQARLSLGVGFSGPQWQYANPTVRLPAERAADQGFRLALYDDSVVAERPMMAGAVPAVPDVSASAFDEFRQKFHYPAGSVIPAMVERGSSEVEREWLRERYTIDSEELAEPLPVLVFRPRHSARPLQPVIFLPPGDSYAGSFPSSDIDITRYDIDFVVRSGRALVWPIIVGTHERLRRREPPAFEELTRRWLENKRIRRAEVGAVIDFLQLSDDFDGDKVSLLAASFGATYVSPHILATEPRIRTAVMMSATLASVDTAMFPDLVNPNSYWPKVDLPVLLLNGRYDISTHLIESRDLLLRSIGTSGADKRGIIYDSSHWPLPPHRVEKDVTDWLDSHLGPVG